MYRHVSLWRTIGIVTSKDITRHGTRSIMIVQINKHITINFGRDTRSRTRGLHTQSTTKDITIHLTCIQMNLCCGGLGCSVLIFIDSTLCRSAIYVTINVRITRYCCRGIRFRTSRRSLSYIHLNITVHCC